jgi:hypothetical protein
VQRVLELDAREFSLGHGQHLALQVPALQAGLDQRFGHDQQAALGVYQA